MPSPLVPHNKKFDKSNVIYNQVQYLMVSNQFVKMPRKKRTFIFHIQFTQQFGFKKIKMDLKVIRIHKSLLKCAVHARLKTPVPSTFV